MLTLVRDEVDSSRLRGLGSRVGGVAISLSGSDVVAVLPGTLGRVALVSSPVPSSRGRTRVSLGT